MDHPDPRTQHRETLEPASSPRPHSRRAAALARLDEAALTAAVRTGVSPRAVTGFVVVALVALAVLGARVVLARTAARPQPLAPAVSSLRLAAGSTPMASPTMASPTMASPPAATPGTAASAAASSAVASPGVLVHVVGQVRRPGVVRLPAGARVQDAVRAAGGATRRADLAAVNLARPVVDGEQVVVPRPGEATVPAASGAQAPGSAVGAPSAAAAGGPVDLNAATPEQLDALPGIGPVLAGRIVDFRTEHGRFSSVDELSDVSGIGDAVLERLRPLVRV